MEELTRWEHLERAKAALAQADNFAPKLKFATKSFDLEAIARYSRLIAAWSALADAHLAAAEIAS